MINLICCRHSIVHGFSDGHLSTNPNRNLIYKEAPGNTGIYIGNISKYNSSKGLVTFKTTHPICLGDGINFENEKHVYTISELIKNNKNIASVDSKTIVQIGRMKGNIKIGDKIFKITSKKLNDEIKNISNRENIKIPLSAKIDIFENKPIILKVSTIYYKDSFYCMNDMNICVKSDVLPIQAKNHPITKEKVENQIRKTSNTPYEFKKIEINLGDNLFIPNISCLNELRRTALKLLENKLLEKYKSEQKNISFILPKANKIHNNKKISVLFNLLHQETDYTKLKNVDDVYVPIRFFAKKNFKNILSSIIDNYNTYVYMPTIIKSNYRNIILNSLEDIVSSYNIKGFVISNIGDIEILKKYIGNYIFIGNYTLNIFNNLSIDEWKKIGINKITLSPELNKNSLIDLCNRTSIPTEIFAYGNIPVMNMGYCLLGNSNKCYPECKAKCNSGQTYYLNDRIGLNFRIIPDNFQTVTTIYNSKITSLNLNDVNCNYIRISILDESIEEVNNIIDSFLNNKKIEGSNYTNSNFCREI